ncbi:MAG: rod shape-determining protein MreC [Candidatus Levyibacteriota bacterium]
MRKRIIPLVIFLVLSVFFVIFSSKVSIPFDFITFLSSPARAYLYQAAHAETKPTQLDILTKENIGLRAKLTTLNELQKDNDALRSQFEDTTIPPETLLPAKVIGFSGSFDAPIELFLNQGKNSGVKQGMAVISGHTLVGKIGRITLWNSELILTVSKKFSTIGTLNGGSSSGVVNGEDGIILLDNVVITDSISKGDTVVSKGDIDASGIGIPADLIVGKVLTVNKSDTSPFQSALIKPLVGFEKLTTVFIVTQ